MNVKREFGIDLLRCILMFFGPFFHSGMLMSKNYTFIPAENEKLYYISAVLLPFRMEFYFAISGYFTYMLLRRRGEEYFFNSRKRGLFYPTVWALLVFLPLTNFIFQRFSEEDRYLAHHIWFLISLSLVSLPIAFFPSRFLLLINKISQLSFFKSIALFLGIYSVLFSTRSIFYRLTQNKIESHLLLELLENFLFLPLIYLVPFIFGALIFKKNINFKISFIYLISVTIFYLVSYLLNSVVRMNSEDFNSLIKISSRLILLVSASVLMFSVFFYLKNLDITSSPVLVFLTKAAMPFYLIHHPLVLLFGYLTKDYTENTFLQFLLICFLTYSFSLLFSYLVLQSEYTKKVFGIR